MKKKGFYMVAMVFLAAACDNSGIGPESDAAGADTTLQEGAPDGSIRKDLLKMHPLTSEELKTIFPFNLRELKLDKEPVINGQTISGHFGARKITLGITDAAGQNYRAATYFLDALNDQRLTDREGVKYVRKEREGIPTLAKYYTGSHTELEFLYKGRFYIHLLGEMEPDELWALFDLAALNKL